MGRVSQEQNPTHLEPPTFLLPVLPRGGQKGTTACRSGQW